MTGPLDWLRSSKTPVEYLKKVDEEENILAAAKSELDSLNARDAEVLLLLDDTIADAHELKKAAVERRMARSQVIIAEGKRRHAEAEAAKQEAAVIALLSEGKRGQSEGVELLKRYESLASEIAKILERLYEIHKANSAAKAAARTAGRSYDGRLPEAIFAAENGTSACGALENAVVLPSGSGTGPYLWRGQTGVSFGGGLYPKPPGADPLINRRVA